MAIDTHAELFDLAAKAIDAHNKLEGFWKKVDLRNFTSIGSDSLIPILIELIIKRIDVVHAFELLTIISHNDALKVLERRYLGDGVSPYTKYGGYQFELSLMLSDYLEIRGTECFKTEILLNSKFKSKLSDSNVVEAMCEALDVESETELKSLIRN
jgi:hypothetical protein